MHIAFLAFTLIFLLPASSPAKKSPANPKYETIEDLKFVDQIYEKIIRKRRSSTAKKIKKTYGDLKKRRYSLVRSRAKSIRKDPIFADYAFLLEAESYLKEGQRKFSRGQTKGVRSLIQKSIDLFIQIEIQRPESSLRKKVPLYVAEAETVLGRLETKRRRWKSAQGIFHKAFQRMADARKLSRMKIEVIRDYLKACTNHPTEICPFWVRRMLRSYPQESKERKLIKSFVPRIAKTELPPRNYSHLTKTYRSRNKDDEAFDEAMGEYLKGDYGDAQKAFKEFLGEYPKSTHRFRALYWLARSLEKKGKKEKARDYYLQILGRGPLTYYGILASLATGEPMEAYIDATLPQAAASDPYLNPSDVMRLKRAERLIAEGALDFASLELKEFSIRGKLSNEFLVYLATLNFETGNFLKTFQILSELGQRNYEGIRSTYALRLIFPLVFNKTIETYASDNHIDSILVLSLIKQESAFEEAIVSRSGALGLMQLMPFTAVDVDDEVELAKVVKPSINVRLGTRYLAKLLQRFKGNIVVSLAGYNAGPTRAARWFRDANPKWGMLEFIESIPYRETRGYVSSIIRNYFWYTYRLNGKRLSSLDYFWGVSGPPEVPTNLPKDTVR